MRPFIYKELIKMPGRLFPLGGPVSERDIVDREDFIQSLEIRLGNGHSIVLSGPRRIGKTSIALEVLRRLKAKGYYVGFVDLFRLTSKRELADEILNACLENRSGISKTTAVLKDGLKKIAGSAKIRTKMQDLDIELALGLQKDDKNDDELLSYAFQLPERMAKRDKKNFVLVFDEFQDVIQIAGENTLKLMRSYFQMQENVTYLFLGSKQGMMNTIFGSKNQAFYRFATNLPIPPIPTEAWRKYIKTKLNKSNINVSDRIINEILNLSGGHPQDTMLLCTEIHYAMLEVGEKSINLDLVQLGYERALLTLSPVFDELLDELEQTANTKHVLICLAKGFHIYRKDKNPNDIKRAVDALLAKAIIEKKGRGKYLFVEPMLKDYLINKVEV